MAGARAEERRAVAAPLDEAAANPSFAKNELERRERLAESGVAPRQCMDQTCSALGAADASYAAKQAAVALMNAPPRTEDIAMAEANLAQAQADLEEQRAQFAKTHLRSPIDGVVLRRYLRPGDVISIQPPTPILERYLPELSVTNRGAVVEPALIRILARFGLDFEPLESHCQTVGQRGARSKPELLGRAARIAD